MTVQQPFNLPSELALEIAKHLDAYSLVCVSRVSRLSRQLALSLLEKLPLALVLSGCSTATLHSNDEAFIHLASLIRQHEQTTVPTGCLALKWACRYTCAEAVRILVPYASMRYNYHKRGQNSSGWDAPLVEAMRNPNPAALEALLQHGAPLDMITRCALSTGPNRRRRDCPPDSEKFYLHHAVLRGFPTVVNYLLDRLLHDDPDEYHATLARDYGGGTPLTLAAGLGRSDIVRILLNHKVSVNQDNQKFMTPLACAAHEGRGEMVRMLLDHGADKELRSIRGETPLFWAARKTDSKAEHKGVIKLLLKQGAEIETVNNDGDSPLLWAVKQGSEEAAQVLLEHGANVNHQNEMGITPLMAAISLDEELPSLVQLLVNYHADLHPRDNYQRTPLHIAVQRGYTRSARILTKAGADEFRVDDRGCTPRGYAREGDKSADFAELFNFLWYKPCMLN